MQRPTYVIVLNCTLKLFHGEAIYNLIKHYIVGGQLDELTSIEIMM